MPAVRKASKKAYDKLPKPDLDALVAYLRSLRKPYLARPPIERDISRGAGDKWQTKGDRCALTYSRALRSDRAAVQLHELLHDRQAESQS